MKISELKEGQSYTLLNKDGRVFAQVAEYRGPLVTAFRRSYLFVIDETIRVDFTMRDVRLRVRIPDAAQRFYHVSERPDGSRTMWVPMGHTPGATPLEAVQKAYPGLSIVQEATNRFTVTNKLGERLDVVITDNPPNKKTKKSAKPTHRKQSRKAFNLWSTH